MNSVQIGNINTILSNPWYLLLGRPHIGHHSVGWSLPQDLSQITIVLVDHNDVHNLLVVPRHQGKHRPVERPQLRLLDEGRHLVIHRYDKGHGTVP